MPDCAELHWEDDVVVVAEFGLDEGRLRPLLYFSPNAFTPEWTPVRDYKEKTMGVSQDEEPFLLDT